MCFQSARATPKNGKMCKKSFSLLIDIISESIQEETDETDLFIYEISDFVSRDGFFGFFHRGLGCRTR
jgi:hypothetical protein